MHSLVNRKTVDEIRHTLDSSKDQPSLDLSTFIELIDTVQQASTMLLPRVDDGGLSDFEFYKYVPNIGGTVFYIIVFLLTTVLHTYQMIRTRTWFMIPFCIGGVCKSTYLPVPLSACMSMQLIWSACSRNHRLYRPRRLARSSARLYHRRVRCTVNLAARCACSLCRFDLHGTRAHRAHGPRRRSAVHPEDLVDQAVCYWGCGHVLDAGIW